MSTSSKEVIQRPDTVVDERFFVPPGIIDVRNVDPDDPEAGGYTDIPSDTSAGSLPVEWVETGEGANSSLPVVQNISIVGQSVRIAADGTTLVDVIIEVDDFNGIANYDIRVTKI
jgi:hypothetical protein